MSNEELDAAEGGRKFAAQFQGFMRALDVVQRIGSLKQAEAEAKERLRVAQQTEVERGEQIESEHARYMAQIAAERESAHNRLNAVKAEAGTVAEKAELAAAKVRDAAAKDAAIMQERAKTHFDDTVGKAELAARSILDNVAKHKAELDALHAAIMKKQQEHAELNSKHDDLKARMEQLRSRIMG